MIFAKPWADALIVLLVVLLFFGPKRLPALGKSLGEGMREFKDSITGKSSSGQDDQAQLSQPPLADPPPGPAPVTNVAAPAPPPASAGGQSESAASVASSEHRS